MKKLTCEKCAHKAKNSNVLNAFECSFDAPQAVPLIGQTHQGPSIIGVAAIRTPITDKTIACHHFDLEVPELSIQSIK